VSARSVTHGALRTERYARLDTFMRLENISCATGEGVGAPSTRCSHCRCSRRIRWLECARTWRRPGTSSASAGSCGRFRPPSRAPPGRRSTDTSPWCARGRWSPSTGATSRVSTRSSRATGLRASRTPSCRTCGWTRTTGRRRGCAASRWGPWRSTASARSSRCRAPSGTASRRRIASR